MRVLTVRYRLGPRNPQTLYLRPLQRNPRIPHRNDNILPPAAHMLRVRPAPRPHARLSRLPQYSHRDVHQRSPGQPPRESQCKRPWLCANRRLQEEARKRRKAGGERRVDKRYRRRTPRRSRRTAEEKTTLHGRLASRTRTGGLVSGTNAPHCWSYHERPLPGYSGH